MVDPAALQPGARLEAVAERDRYAVAVLYPVRVGRWNVDAVPRLELEDCGAFLISLAEHHVAVNRRPGKMLLQLLLREYFPIRRAEHADRLAAADLKQEIDLVIHVIWRDRPG